jgi:hypothetical protein
VDESPSSGGLRWVLPCVATALPPRCHVTVFDYSHTVAMGAVHCNPAKKLKARPAIPAKTRPTALHRFIRRELTYPDVTVALPVKHRR